MVLKKSYHRLRESFSQWVIFKRKLQQSTVHCSVIFSSKNLNSGLIKAAPRCHVENFAPPWHVNHCEASLIVHYIVLQSMPMILLNIVAKYQRDEVVICFWIGSFCRSNVGLLLSGGLRHFDELIETKNRIVLQSIPMILLNIVAKYQRDEVVICFWISSFYDLNVLL